MAKVKFTFVFAVILYTGVAIWSAPFFEIHWIHIVNSFMLSSILYNLLDFKFSCIENDPDEEYPQ